MSAFDWIAARPGLVWWFAGLTILSFFVTLVAMVVVVVRMSPDYFLYHEPPPDSWRARHPVLHTVVRVAKNLVGLGLVAAGLVLSLPLIPGQGILTVFIGLTLVEFPGKRTLELRLARQRAVQRTLDWIRAKAGRPPLELPPRND